MDRLIPIVELSVAEAYAIVTEKLGVDRRSLPPLDAIENEDWGRDLLLSRLSEVSDERLAAVGLCRFEAETPMMATEKETDDRHGRTQMTTDQLRPGSDLEEG